MWNSRRLWQVLATLSVAMMIYAILVGLLLRQIDQHLIHTFSPAPVKRIPDGSIELFGVIFPWWELFTYSCVLPAFWRVCAIHGRIQQAHRARHDLCPHCGWALSDWRGRCPGCGERIGPDGNHVHTLRAPVR